MNFRESITTTVAKLLQVKQPVEKTTITEQVAPSSIQSVFEVYNRLGYDGFRVWSMDMATFYYKSDSRVGSVIDTLSRDCVKGGFRLIARANAEAEDLANELIEKVKFNANLEDYIRNWYLDGDLFLENGINEENKIVALARRPAKEMRRLTNRIDEFVDPRLAFRWQLNYNGAYFNANEQNMINYAQWQINHARLARVGFEKYGRPLLSNGIGIWRRIEQGEDDMVKARATRAGIIRQHVLKGANPDEINTYKEENKSALESAFAAVVNLFTNTDASLNQEEGSMQLPPIDDIQHHLESWFAGSPVPMALVAYGKNLNRDVIDLKEKQYRRSIEQMTSTIQDTIIMPIIELQWLLNGILPETVEYETEWKSKDPLNATDLGSIADAILRFKAAGAKKELIALFISRFVPGVELDTIMGFLEDAPPMGDPSNPNSGMGVRSSGDGTGNNMNSKRMKSTRKSMGVGLNK